MLSVRRNTGSGLNNGTSQFFHSDMTGNVRMLSDASGSVTDTYLYKAFGDQISASGGSTNPYRFGGDVGYYTDKLNRVYIRARHYAPQQARWLSEDPLGLDAGDWNFYRYSKNNPTNRNDPSGLMPAINCPINISSSVARWCKNFSRLNEPGVGDYISRCVRHSGIKCQPPRLKERGWCLRRMCQPGVGKVQCYANCYPCPGCGHADKKTGIAHPDPYTNIMICTTSMNAGCGDIRGDATIPPEDVTFLHEAMHGCGIRHHPGGGNKQPDCDDVYACCIVNALRKTGSRDPLHCRRRR